MTEIKEVADNVGKRNKKNALDVLKDVEQAVNESDRVGDIVVMLKIDGAYVRYTSKINDTMGLISFLELMKHDCLRRMTG